MTTAQPRPDEPQPLGATLRRSSDDRILLGLCSGIARASGLSTLTVRLGTVLVAFVLLPLVLLAYTITAVIVPRDDGAALIGTGTRDRRDVWVALALTILAAPAALSAGTDGGSALFTDHFGFVLLPLVALAGLAFLALNRDQRWGSPLAAPTGPTPQPASAPHATPNAAAAAHEPHTFPAVTPFVADTVSAATATAAPTDATDAPASDLDADPADPTADADAPTDGDDPTVSFEKATPPPSQPPTGPTFVHSPPPPPGPKRPGLTLPVLGLVAMVPAVFGILLAGGAIDSSATSWAVMLAVMAVVSAAGAVAIAILRPSYLGAGLLVLLAVALGVSSIGVGQFGSVIDDGIGERHYRVTNAADLRTPFVLGAGELDIDLRQLRLAPRQRVTVHARLGFGELNIAVPRGTRITTSRNSGVANLATSARDNGTAVADLPNAPTIVLDLRGRGVDARVLTGNERDVHDLEILAQTDLGFWNGSGSNRPFEADEPVAPAGTTSP